MYSFYFDDEQRSKADVNANRQIKGDKGDKIKKKQSHNKNNYLTHHANHDLIQAEV